jgi:integrase/recombinase XerD
MTSDTSPHPISPLRARMIEDMTVRGFKGDTRRDYVRHVRAFAAFIGRSPDTATAEDLRLFQLHQNRAACSRRASTVRSRPCASFLQ